MSHPYAIFEILVSLLVGFIVYRKIVVPMRRDTFRADIRRIRDRLFDYMWENNLPYDTAEYVRLRQRLNGLIRLSERLGPLFFLSIIVIYRHELDDHISVVSDKVPEPLRSRLREAEEAAAKRLGQFVFNEGCMWLFFKLVFLFGGIAKKVTSSVQWTMNAAYDFGSPQLSGLQKSFL